MSGAILIEYLRPGQNVHGHDLTVTLGPSDVTLDGFPCFKARVSCHGNALSAMHIPTHMVVDFVDGVNHLSDMEEAIEQIDELISRLAAAERVVKAIRAVVDEQGGLLVAGGYGLRDKARELQRLLARELRHAAKTDDEGTETT